MTNAQQIELLERRYNTNEWGDHFARAMMLGMSPEDARLFADAKMAQAAMQNTHPMGGLLGREVFQ